MKFHIVKMTSTEWAPTYNAKRVHRATLTFAFSWHQEVQRFNRVCLGPLLLVIRLLKGWTSRNWSSLGIFWEKNKLKPLGQPEEELVSWKKIDRLTAVLLENPEAGTLMGRDHTSKTACLCISIAFYLNSNLMSGVLMMD